MTDFTHIYNHNDMLSVMADYLSPSDLASLRLVCQTLKNKISAAVILQPLYNKLYDIDKTLPAQINPTNAFLNFKQAFEKIRTMQQEEITFFKKQGIDFPNISENSIEVLQQTDALINQINIDKINKAIDNALEEDALMLFRAGITRFIVPEDKKLYFTKIKKLYCDGNQLAVLSLEDCIALEEVYCSNNRIKILSFNQHARIRVLNCSQNLLRALNFKGFSHLEDLECSFNECRILNLENCTKLESVYCRESNEFLKTLNLFDCAKLNSLHIGNGIIDSLQVVELNIQGTSQMIQNRFANKMEALLFSQLDSLAYFERGDIIQSLGDRYNIGNCLKYGCFYDAGLIANSVLQWEKLNLFLPSTFLTKKSSAIEEEMISENKQNNKNNEEDTNANEDFDFKMRK